MNAMKNVQPQLMTLATWMVKHTIDREILAEKLGVSIKEVKQWFETNTLPPSLYHQEINKLTGTTIFPPPSTGAEHTIREADPPGKSPKEESSAEGANEAVAEMIAWLDQNRLSPAMLANAMDVPVSQVLCRLEKKASFDADFQCKFAVAKANFGPSRFNGHTNQADRTPTTAGNRTKNNMRAGTDVNESRIDTEPLSAKIPSAESSVLVRLVKQWLKDNKVFRRTFAKEMLGVDDSTVKRWFAKGWIPINQIPRVCKIIGIKSWATSDEVIPQSHISSAVPTENRVPAALARAADTPDQQRPDRSLEISGKGLGSVPTSPDDLHARIPVVHAAAIVRTNTTDNTRSPEGGASAPEDSGESNAKDSFKRARTEISQETFSRLAVVDDHVFSLLGGLMWFALRAGKNGRAILRSRLHHSWAHLNNLMEGG